LRYYQLPADVNDVLGERIVRLMGLFRNFFIEYSMVRDEDLLQAYNFFLPKVSSIFRNGLLGRVRRLELETKSVLGLESQGSGKNLSLRDSFSLVRGFLRTLKPSEVADLVGQTVTDLSFLKKEVALTAYASASPAVRKWLWMFHKLIDQQNRSIMTSRVLYYYPNTTKGRAYPDSVCKSVTEAIFREYGYISNYRNALGNGPCRDLLTEVLSLGFFDVFSENRNLWRNLFPSEVDARLRELYPKHRRGLPAVFASSLGRLQAQSLKLRIELSRFGEHDENTRRTLSGTESVISILCDRMTRTEILKGFLEM